MDARARQVRAGLTSGSALRSLLPTPRHRPRRRPGVFRRALRREVSRLREPRRILAIAIIAVVGGVLAAVLIVRGDAAGADARVYWEAVRSWLAGGDPYHPTGPVMPYLYAPWLLPLFWPWSLLPWEVAWFLWRGGTVLLLLGTIHWAHRRRPLTTAATVVVLSVPMAVNIDTGNVNLILTLLLWQTQTLGPRLAGLFWALSTATKWIPAVFFLVLAPRARTWGLAWLGLAGILTLATLPATILQLHNLLALSQPPRIDYLLLLWALGPWLWREPDPFSWLRPSSWPSIRARLATRVTGWSEHWRRDPAGARVEAGARLRSYLGLSS